MLIAILCGLALALPVQSAESAPTTQRAALTQPALRPGDYVRHVAIDGLDRSYLVHVPPRCDARKPTPVVLVYHGAWTNAKMIEIYSGMDKKSDEANFIVVYPNGFAMRVGGPQALVFNAWNSPLSQTLPHPPPDDVKFAGKLIDDLATVVNVDRKRVFAAGMSNGGMMCYLLAGELSDRIAAIASIAGPQVVADARPGRPVPVLHFHGDADKVVPFAGPADGVEKLMQFRSVDETIKIWTKLDGCPDDPKVTEIADSAKDGTTITKKVFGPGKDDSEVVLYVIHGGGHTWPGRPGPDAIIGKSTKNLSANDVMWDFFLKHPMK